MKIDSIFEIINKRILSIKFHDKEVDEFTQCFRNWNDAEYLEDFFHRNLSDIQSGFFGNITVEEAVISSIKEAEDLETSLLSVAESGKFEECTSLGDVIFEPLHKNDNTQIHLKSKARGSIEKYWLRLFAIRILSELYVVTGGAIKLTSALQDREHTKLELKKLNITKKYLESIGFLDETDYEHIEIRVRHE